MIMYSSTSRGGPSISVEQRHRRSGCPSPTFLYAMSTLLSLSEFIVIQLRVLVGLGDSEINWLGVTAIQTYFSRPSLMVALVHSYR